MDCAVFFASHVLCNRVGLRQITFCICTKTTVERCAVLLVEKTAHHEQTTCNVFHTTPNAKNEEKCLWWLVMEEATAERFKNPFVLQPQSKRCGRVWFGQM